MRKEVMIMKRIFKFLAVILTILSLNSCGTLLAIGGVGLAGAFLISNANTPHRVPSKPSSNCRNIGTYGGARYCTD